jgi:hypothetical protein
MKLSNLLSVKTKSLPQAKVMSELKAGCKMNIERPDFSED